MGIFSYLGIFREEGWSYNQSGAQVLSQRQRWLLEFSLSEDADVLDVNDIYILWFCLVINIKKGFRITKKGLSVQYTCWESKSYLQDDQDQKLNWLICTQNVPVTFEAEKVTYEKRILSFAQLFL